MRIIGLINRHDHVSARYRLKAFRSHWEQAGLQVEFRESPSKWYHGWKWDRDFAAADAVILQRRLLDPWKVRRLRRAAKKLIFDFDDAVFLRDSYHPRGNHCSRKLSRFREMLSNADLVVAGNSWLQQQTTRADENCRCEVIPTCVDLQRYPLARHIPAPTIRIAWIGSSSTLQGLQQVREILEAIGKAFPQVRLKLICDRTLPLQHLPVDFCPWSEATEARDLADAEIGMSWLPDDDWSRGKCGLKVLQYLAAGLPVLANPVGVQAEMIQPGVHGFLPKTTQEWLYAVGTLVHNAAMRKLMGQAGRRLVEVRYDVSVGARRWLELLGASRPRLTWRRAG